MKVSGSGGPGAASGPGRSRGAGSGQGFSLQGAGAAGPAGSTSPAASVTAVAGLGALLALQEAGGPLERRRRAVGRAGRILDVLDEVKLALMDGELSVAQMDRLSRAIRAERDQTEDPELEALLDQIETRAAVELAKLDVARARAAHTSG